MTATLTGRRLVRSFGYRGARPRIALCAGLIVVLIAEAGAVGGSALYVRGSGTVSGYLIPGAVVLSLYACAGPAVLLGESSMASQKSVERALETLPLSRRQIQQLTWVPPMLTSVLLTALLVPPAVAVLLTLGEPAGIAVPLVLAACSASTAVAAAALTLVKVAVRGRRWSPLHYPVALMTCMASTVYSITRIMSGGEGLTVGDRALLGPMIMKVVFGLHPVGSATLWCAAAVGAVLTAAGLTTAFLVSNRAAPAPRLLQWRLSDTARPLAGDLVHLVRTPALSANLLATVLLNVVGVLLLTKLSTAMLTPLTDPLLAVFALIAALPLRMVRGTFRTVWPQPELAGAERTRWVWRLTVASALLSLLTIAPVLVALLTTRVGSLFDLPQFVWAVVACSGTAVVLGWVVPVDADDSTSQVVLTWVFLLVASAVTFGGRRLILEWPAACGLASLFVLAAAVLAGLFSEPRRWRRASPRPFSPQSSGLPNPKELST